MASSGSAWPSAITSIAQICRTNILRNNGRKHGAPLSIFSEDIEVSTTLLCKPIHILSRHGRRLARRAACDAEERDLFPLEKRRTCCQEGQTVSGTGGSELLPIHPLQLHAAALHQPGPSHLTPLLTAEKKCLSACSLLPLRCLHLAFRPLRRERKRISKWTIVNVKCYWY